MALPTLSVYAAGQPAFAPWAVFGAFTAMYGRIAPLAHRMLVQAGVGVSLALSVALGGLVANTSHSAWWIVLAGACLAALTGLASLRLGWRPVGPLFHLITFSVAAHSLTPARTVDLVAPALVTLSSAAAAILISTVVVEQPAPSPPFTAREVSVTTQLSAAAEYGLSAALAGALATASGLEHAYWAMLSAVVPFMAADHPSRLLRAIHRMVGTALGLSLSVALLAILRPAVSTAILLVIVLQACAELLIRRHYGWALVLITPLALIMTQTVDPEPLTRLLFDRMAQTAIGVGTAIVVILARSLLRPRRQPFQDKRLKE